MRELIFVYNAKSANMLMDYAHKFISPATYDCDLCKLTHSNFGVRNEWGAFIKDLAVKMDFYYIDEFEDQFGLSFHYPIILEKVDGELNTLLSNTEIAKLDGITDLIRVMQEHSETNNKA